MGYVLAGLIILLGAATPPGPNPHLGRAKHLLASYQEDQALKVLEMAIRWAHNTPHDLAQAHFLTGLAWAAKANERNAIESFRQARILDPELQLEGDYSPRIKAWFEGAISSGTLPARESQFRLDLVNLPKATAEPETAAVPKPLLGLRWAAAAGGALGVTSMIIGATQGWQAQAYYQQSIAVSDVVLAQGEYRKAATSAERANILYIVGGGLLVVASAALVLSF